MKYVFLLLAFFSYDIAIGQGQVTVSTTAPVDKMMDKFTSQNQSQETIQGWRIQIITTDDRRKMETAKSKFSNLYPNVDVEWKHVAPYYRVKVGAYENKMQLMGFLLELKKDFRGVIPVRDNVKKSELIGY